MAKEDLLLKGVVGGINKTQHNSTAANVEPCIIRYKLTASKIAFQL